MTNNEWKRKNATAVHLRLFHKTDADILAMFDDKQPLASQIKAMLRELQHRREHQSSNR